MSISLKRFFRRASRRDGCPPVRQTARHHSIVTLMIFAFMSFVMSSPAQPKANYDETKVPSYTLPDPLTLTNGSKVTDAKAWREKRRPEILELFRSQVYGRSPGRPTNLMFAVTSTNPRALGGKATRKQVAVYFTGEPTGPKMDILIYLPNGVVRPVPGFVGLNFD